MHWIQLSSYFSNMHGIIIITDYAIFNQAKSIRGHRRLAGVGYIRHRKVMHGNDFGNQGNPHGAH
jgi:hypothetical protein